MWNLVIYAGDTDVVGMQDFESLWEETWVNINGEFERGPDASVSVLDWSFTYGDGIFEGVAMADGKLLKIEYHLDRLYRSAKRVGIEIPISREEMRDRWIETARRNEMTEGYMRPLVSRGVGPLGIHNYDELSEPTVVIIPQRHRVGHHETVDERKARMTSVRAPSPVSRDPRVKANQYLPNILAVRELTGTEASVPIFLDQEGYITEAGSANIFVVDANDEIKTPHVAGILPGTTRRVVMELAEAGDIPPVEETRLTPYDIVTAEECFMTGSLKGVAAITHLNGDQIGAGNAGPVAKATNETLFEYLLETGTPID